MRLETIYCVNDVFNQHYDFSLTWAIIDEYIIILIECTYNDAWRIKYIISILSISFAHSVAIFVFDFLRVLNRGLTKFYLILTE